MICHNFMGIRFSLESTHTLGMHRDFIARLDIVSDIIAKEDYAQFHEGSNRIIRLIKNETNFSDRCFELLEKPNSLWYH